MQRPLAIRARHVVTALPVCLLILCSPATTLPAPPPEAPRRIGAAEQVQVPLVLIDVVVRDGKDRPVSGLTREDFELLVDRLPVAPDEIETFEEFCAPLPESAPGTAVATASQALDAAPPSSGPSGHLPLRHIVVVIDFSHLSLSGRRQSLSALRRYLETRPLSGDERLMLLAHRKGLRLVQDFTTSRQALLARLDEMIPDTASLEMEVLEECSKIYDVSSRPCDANPRTGVVDSCTARLGLANHYATEEENRARRTLKALEDLMPAMAALPGRKAMILFSDVLRDEPGIQYMALARETPQSMGIDIKPDLLRLTREANAAGVALYTIHAGGIDAPDGLGCRGIETTSNHEDPHRLDMASAARTGLDAALSVQTTLAVETGGRALQRTNDLARIMDTTRQDMACHYLIGYRGPGAGDNQRHSLIVRLRPDAQGNARRHDVRHRPYFIDYAPGERRDRRMRSALDLPRLHGELPVTLEAFALAPSVSGRHLLVKASVPLSSLSLLPAGEDHLEGGVRIKGEAHRDGKISCEVDVELPVRATRGATAGTLVYETSCVLAPGRYDLSLAVMDLASQEVGARRETMVVPPLRRHNEPLVSDVHLWVQDPSAVLVSSDVERLGLSDRPEGTTPGAWLPLGRRVLSPGQPAMVSVLLCPASPGEVTSEAPIRVRRTLKGEGEAPVAEFRDLILSEPPDPASGCYQLMHRIPKDTLGPGVYTFLLQATGVPLGGALVREADISVE